VVCVGSSIAPDSRRPVDGGFGPRSAVRLAYVSRKYNHVTPLLTDLQWLRVLERITFRLAVLVYRCQHGIAPPYFANELHRVADVESRQRLRSAATTLVVPNTVHATIGDRSFPVAAARVWNSLSQHVTSPSRTVFRRRLKTELFIQIQITSFLLRRLHLE